MTAIVALQIVAALAPQPSGLPGLTRYNVQVCSPQAITISGGLVHAAVQTKIRPAGRADVQRIYTLRARTSPWRITALTIEVLLWGFSAAEASKAIKIKERWAGAPPAVAGGLRALTTFVKSEAPTDALPANLLGPWVEIPAPAGGPRACAEVSLFAWTQQDEKPFEVQVQ